MAKYRKLDPAVTAKISTARVYLAHEALELGMVDEVGYLDQAISQAKKLASAEKAVSTVQTQLKSSSGDIAKLKGVAGDLSRLMSSAKTNQAEVERVADALNRINLDLAKLSKRVQSNEESVNSINAFRKQVNASLTSLESTVRVIQARP